MITTKNNLFLAILSVIITHTSIAQCREPQWPENRSLAEEKVALYGDALKQKRYRDAVPALQWMLTHAPGWHIKLYIDAVKIYSNLIQNEEDPVKQGQLIDSLMWLYDQRMVYCGDTVKCFNKKLFYAYKYSVKKKEKVENLLANYDSLLALAQGKISDGNLLGFMNTVKANRVLLKNLSDEQVIDRYDQIMSILNQKLDKAKAKEDAKKVKKLERYKGIIDGILVDMVKVDCDFVRKNLAPKFKTNPDNLILAKKIFGFMLQGKCTDDPLWLQAGEVIIKTEKDFGIIKNIALKYIKSNTSLTKAENLLKEGLTIADQPSEKADMLTYMGVVETKKGSKVRARDYFRQAIAMDKNNKTGYEKIGDLYYGSFNQCAKKQNMAEDRLVYIAAYNMYQRAGNTKKMVQAKAQFPSKEEIFLFNWKAGDTMQTGCWINESVTLKTRD